MRVVVAMSGGVDSSVVAGLLKEQGHEVIGVHMKLHDASPAAAAAATGSSGHCCGLDDALDARRVAAALDIPFYVMNLQEAFKAAVMEDFAAAYAQGLTPNPCVQCNGVLKFNVLLKRALSLGADALATGHYARTDGTRMWMATDKAKDQSYFLHPILPAALARTLFPLGGMTKPEVRAIAARLALPTASKPESMEVCFLPDDDHTRFVSEQRPDLDGAGEIVDEQGRVLGKHDGYWRFTIGQRKGLGVAVGHPIFVLRIDPTTRQVVVGPEDRLQSQRLEARRVSWLRQPAPGEATLARIRHRGGLIPCTVTSLDPLRLEFLAPARAVTPGQSVVVYTPEEELLGGGIIVRGEA